MIRVLLGHRGALLRGALAALLSDEDDLDVVAELGCGEEVQSVAVQVRPHVVVLDHALPGNVGVHDLCGTLPDCRVLTLLDKRSCGQVGRSLARLAPRVGLMSIDATPKDFVDGVRRLAGGEPVLDPELAVVALRSGDTVLTDRECDVLRLAALGSTAKEIATSLCLSTGTVRNYLSKILNKLSARTRIEAIRIAQDSGWI